MDEPLSALDRFTKEDILPYLERLHAALAIPVLYVSHDIAEVERLADHIVLLDKGQVVASGALGDIQSDPASPLARLHDAAVSLMGRITAQDTDYGLTQLSIKGGRLFVPAIVGSPGDIRRIRIIASDVSLARGDPSDSTILNNMPARVISAQRQGLHQVNVVVGLGNDGSGERVLSHITRKSWEKLQLSEGSQVMVQIKGVALA
jgi:molybdate transport system ATP-binding protein